MILWTLANLLVLIDHARLETGRLDLRRRIAFLPDVPPTLPDADVLMHVGSRDI
jgi:hypothetical protein